MTLKKIAEILEARVISGSDLLDTDIQWAYSADLMSDVLYYGGPNAVLITGLARPHTIQTVALSGLKGVILVQDKKPDDDTVKLAEQKNIPLLVTSLGMYTASGKLFQAGLKGCPEE